MKKTKKKNKYFRFLYCSFDSTRRSPLCLGNLSSIFITLYSTSRYELTLNLKHMKCVQISDFFFVFFVLRSNGLAFSMYGLPLHIRHST